MKRNDFVPGPGEWDYIEPYDGAEIRVSRGKYYHYGVYLGDGRVCSFGEGDPDKDTNHPEENLVAETDLGDFLRGGLLEVRVLSKAEKKAVRPAEEIIETARSMIGTGGYDFLRNNCEHYATLCIFGVKSSPEADKFISDTRALMNRKMNREEFASKYLK